jgi:hypothetical protein
VKLSSSTLRKAAEIQEQIEQLEAELQRVMEVAETTEPTDGHTGAEQPPRESPSSGRRRASRSLPAATSNNGRGRGRRSTSPSGPLAPAVVKVLKSRGSPMSVSEILDGLMGNGYKFSSPEPKKNLFARIYRLKGVRQVGPGKFAAE